MTKRAKVRLLFFCVASLSIALVISLVIGICFFVSLHKTEKTEEINRYKVHIGLVDTKKTTYNAYIRDVMRGGVLCTNFSQISDKCGYTMIVNGDEIRYYLNNEASDMLTLRNGDTRAYLNDNPVHMAVPMYKIGENIYLPLDFVANYFEGISVVVDSEKSEIVIEYNDPKTCSLRLKYPQVLDPVDRDAVPNN